MKNASRKISMKHQTKIYINCRMIFSEKKIEIHFLILLVVRKILNQITDFFSVHILKVKGKNNRSYEKFSYSNIF